MILYFVFKRFNFANSIIVIREQKRFSSMIGKFGAKFSFLAIFVVLLTATFSGYAQETVGIIGQIEQFHPEIGRAHV